MLASLFNSARIRRLGLVMTVTAVSATGCTDVPEIDRPGTWKPQGINDQNLRAMLVDPRDAYSGAAAVTSRGNEGSRAVTRLLTDRRRPLLDASISRIAGSGGASADSAPAPAASGGGSGGSSP